MASRQSSEDYTPTEGYTPEGHISDESATPAPGGPRLGFVGWVRFLWRQLTSMRTAIILLLLLAIAAIPGSLVPQTTSDPNGVIQFRANDPELAAILDAFGLFSTFSSPWFSAVYILLFISLIGCIVPRTWHHLKAVFTPPPRTPSRLERMEGFITRPWSSTADAAVEAARGVLKRRGYRTVLHGQSVSAERGYLRETGNLVFHVSLIGILVTVALGGGLGYQGQRVVAEGFAFTNTKSSYDSFNPGSWFQDWMLAPFSVRLDSMQVTYETQNLDAYGIPLDYRAEVTVTERGGAPRQEILKVNEPLTIAGTQVYMLGNGYAPVITVRDPEGDVVFAHPTLFRPQDMNLTSIGVVKIPDGLPEQVGMRGFFYPSAVELTTGALASSFPDLINPVLTLEVYTGDLGLDDGSATNAYVLDTDGLTQVAGREADTPTIVLKPGEVAELPNGLGTVELTAIPRFVALDIHSDPAQQWVLVFAILAILGLLTSLFVPRRRVWAKAVDRPDGTVVLEWAGLARGEDPRLAEAVAELADLTDPTSASSAERGDASADGPDRGTGTAK